MTNISGPGGVHTIFFDWDHYLTFEGNNGLESTFSTKNPRTITGSLQSLSGASPGRGTLL